MSEKQEVKMTTEELASWETKIQDKSSELKKLEKEKEIVALEVKQLTNNLALTKKKTDPDFEALLATENRQKSTIRNLEETYERLSHILDSSATSTQLFQGKQKDFELFKETHTRLIQEKQDEIHHLRQRGEQARPSTKEMADLTAQLTTVKQDHARLQQAAAELADRLRVSEEQEPAFLAKYQKAQKLSSELDTLRQALAEAARKEQALREQSEKEAKLRAFLASEVEELQHKQRMQDLQLEEESRTAREDLLKVKKVAPSDPEELAAREHKFAENEQLLADLRRREAKLLEDLEFVRGKVASFGRHEAADDRGGDDMKIIESLQIEKKELRGELELLSRAKAKTEAAIKAQQDLLALRQENLLRLTAKLFELQPFDRDAVLKSLKPEEKERLQNAVGKSPADMLQLLEKLVVDNVRMHKQITVAAAKKLLTE